MCGESLNAEPLHFLSCPILLRSMTLRHNKVLFNLAQIASILHIPTQIEPRVDYKDRRRTDGLFIFQEEPTAIDVSITHPCARSYVNAARVQLGAASQREKKKTLEYDKRHAEQGIKFLPFVMETLGGFGPRAVDFIKAMVKDAYLTGTSLVVPGNTESFIRKVSAVALQVGNALLCIEGRKRTRCGDHLRH